MNSFFKQTAETMIAKDIDRFPLLKIQLIINWQPIADYLEQQKGRYARHNGGCPAYSLKPIELYCNKKDFQTA